MATENKLTDDEVKEMMLKNIARQTSEEIRMKMVKLTKEVNELMSEKHYPLIESEELSKLFQAANGMIATMLFVCGESAKEIGVRIGKDPKEENDDA